MGNPEEQPPTVLIAAPDDPIRHSLTRLLESEGCRPLHARDGHETLSLLASGRADAALVDDDLTCPGVLEILGALRERGLGVPVLVVSAAATARRAVQAMQHGAWDFLPKPVVPADLFVALRAALAPAGIAGPFAPAGDGERRGRRSRLEALGRLTGGVAHDFNNLLTVINGYAQMLHHGLGPDSPLQVFAREIVRAVEHGAALTRQLLSAGAAPQPVVLDLNEATRRAARLARPVLGDAVVLTLDLAPEPCCVRATPGQLEQVVINLAVNARDAMPQGGTLCVRTERDPSGGWVWLVVSDSGCGMDQATQARLFEPFFTTKTPEKGTGLGLATVHGIVTGVGGRIEVRSAPGRGTTFTVALPRAAGAPAPQAPAPPAARAAGAGTILLVEADEGVRSLMGSALALEGHRVLLAGDGAEALALAAGHAGDIDLLIAEVLLPRMTGSESARALRGRRPQVGVLFVSSDPSSGLADQVMGAEEMLVKPFSPNTLAERVGEALNRRGVAAPAARR